MSVVERRFIVENIQLSTIPVATVLHSVTLLLQQ